MSRDAQPGTPSTDALRLERAARRWVEVGPDRAPDRLVAAIIAAVDTTPQQRRRRWWWPLPSVRPPVRQMATATLAIALLATTATNLAGIGSVIERLVPGACGRGALVTVAGRTIGSEGAMTGVIPLEAPTGIAVGLDGTVYVSDSGTGAVWRIPTTGAPTVIAGVPSSTGEAATDLAPDATIAPRGIALDADGNLYVVDGAAPRVLRVDPAGRLTTVAGTGISGSSGDGGPATAAQVESWTVATGTRGELYVDGASRYRVIGADGIIEPFAGSGIPGWSGDGGPATEASMLTTAGIAVAPDGRVYVGDQARIRMVDPAGVITTIAGTGSSGPPVDGTPASTSRLLHPGAMAMDNAGVLYLVDGDAVRMIDPSGMLRTVAGAITPGAGLHCGQALGPTLAAPGGLAVHDGVLYIADTGNGRVVKVVP